MSFEKIFAALFWGLVSMGFLAYAKKERDPAAFVVAMLMILVSYLVTTPLLMSGICAALIFSLILYKKYV